MAAIASLERIVAPGDLVITSVDSPPADDGEVGGSILASFRIRTYVANPPRSAEPAESSARNGDPQS